MVDMLVLQRSEFIKFDQHLEGLEACYSLCINMIVRMLKAGLSKDITRKWDD